MIEHVAGLSLSSSGPKESSSGSMTPYRGTVMVYSGTCGRHFYRFVPRAVRYSAMPGRTTAAEIMRRKLLTLTPRTTVMDATALLLKKSISGAPVLDRSGRLVGVLSELDCTNHLVHCISHNEPTGCVGDLMSKDCRTVPPDATLLTVAHHFNTLGVRRLPVVDKQGQLLGQISRRDLMRALYEMAAPERTSKPRPLYLSAIYDTEDLPAKLDPGTKTIK